VVSFTSRYPWDRRLGGPQSRSGQRGEEKIRDYLDSNSDPSVVQPVASHYTDCAIIGGDGCCRVSFTFLPVVAIVL
jgi:hypothetical protein